MKGIELSDGNKLRAAVSAVVGAVVLGCLAIGYAGAWRRAYEMTFISNGLTGVLLLFSAVRLCATGRAAPHVLFLDCAVMLIVVMTICAVFAPETTHGFPSCFLHVINPLLMTAFYMTFCDGRRCHYALASTALVMPALYYAFMIVYGRVTGDSIYVYFDPNGMSAPTLILYGATAAAIVTVVSFGLLRLNRAFAEKRGRHGVYSERSGHAVIQVNK